MAAQRNAPEPDPKKAPTPQTQPPEKPESTPKTPDVIPQDEPVDPVRAVLAGISALSPEERQRLAQVGFAMPLYVTDDVEGESRWGYRCRHCNHVALEFVGLRFRDTHGQEIDYVPPARPYDVPFRQPSLDPRYVNRSHPVCQHCMRPIDLAAGNFITRRIIDIRPWVESRDRQVAIAKDRGRKPPPTSLPEGYDLQDKVAGFDAKKEFHAAVPRDEHGQVIDDPAARYTAQKRQAISDLSDAMGLGRIAFPEKR